MTTTAATTPASALRCRPRSNITPTPSTQAPSPPLDSLTNTQTPALMAPATLSQAKGPGPSAPTTSMKAIAAKYENTS